MEYRWPPVTLDIASAAAPLVYNPSTGALSISTMVGDSGSGGARGVVPAPGAGDAAANKFLKADATWTVIPTPADFIGDSGSGGVHGLVPAPAAGDAAAGKFLKADATWATAVGAPNFEEVANGPSFPGAPPSAELVTTWFSADARGHVETNNSLNLSGWVELTSFGANATPPSTEPVLVAPDSDLSGSGQRSVHFTDSPLTYTSGAPQFDFGSGDFVAAVLVKVVTGGANRFICGKDSYNNDNNNYTGWFIQMTAADKVTFSTRHIVAASGPETYLMSSGSISIGDYHVIIVDRVSGVLTITIDGVLAGTTAESGTTDVDNAAAFRLGGADLVDAGFDGTLNSVLLYKGVTADGDLRTALTTYLSSIAGI